MKVYQGDNGDQLIVGYGEEIKPVYKALRRAWRTDRFSVGPSHLNYPILVNGNVYGIELVRDEGRFWIRSASTVLELIGAV